MKLIFFLFLLTISVEAYGQADVIRTKPVPASGASFNYQGVGDANLKAIFSFQLPRVASNTLNGAKDTAGHAVYNTTIGRICVYKGSGVWDTLAVGGTLSDYYTKTQSDARYVKLSGQTQQNIQGILAPQGISMYGGVSPDVGGITTSGISIGSALADRPRLTKIFTGSVPKWEYGGDSPDSNFYIGRYNSGTLTDKPVSINRFTGEVNIKNNIISPAFFTQIQSGQQTSLNYGGINIGSGNGYTNYISSTGTGIMQFVTATGVAGGVFSFNPGLGDAFSIDQAYVSVKEALSLENVPTTTDIDQYILVRDSLGGPHQVRKIKSSAFAFASGTFTKTQVDSAIAAHEINDLYASASTSGIGTYTSSILQGVVVTSVIRSGLDYQPTASTSPGSNEYHYDGTAGSIKFGDAFLTSIAERLHFKYKASQGSGGTGIIATYPTFASISFPLTKQGIIEVSADETRGGNYVLYAIGSAGATTATNLHFIAATQTNNP